MGGFRSAEADQTRPGAICVTMSGMGTGRRVLISIACAGIAAAAAVAAPSAGAQGPLLPGCEYPKSWDTASTDLQYEAYLFSGQTTYDLGRLTSDNAAAFLTATVKRALSLTTASADIGGAVVTDGARQPPTC